LEESYDSLDRATMATWKASNALGWGAVALAASLVLHQVADQLTLTTRLSVLTAGTLNGRPWPGLGWTGWSLLQRFWYPAVISVVVGLLIGTVIGKKVWRHQVGLASLTALAYVAVTWLVLEISAGGGTATSTGSLVQVSAHRGLPSGAVEWSYSAVALLAVVVAPLWSWFLVRRTAKRTST